MLALIGGYLGVLFMVPLRRPLIVEEHGILQYPEGTACADVIKAGASGGSTASRVFYRPRPRRALRRLPERKPARRLARHPRIPARLRLATTSERLHPSRPMPPPNIWAWATSSVRKTAGIIFAGGVFSWLVLMPLLYFFGKNSPRRIYPGTVPIAQMGPSDLWATYIRPMGAGAVAAAGLITLLQHSAHHHRRVCESGFKNMAKTGAGTAEKPIRTEHDLSMGIRRHGRPSCSSS